MAYSASPTAAIYGSHSRGFLDKSILAGTNIMFIPLSIEKLPDSATRRISVRIRAGENLTNPSSASPSPSPSSPSSSFSAYSSSSSSSSSSSPLSSASSLSSSPVSVPVLESWFRVEDPRSKDPPWRGRLFHRNQAWEVARQDLHFCDWKARMDVLAIKNLHDQVVNVLNPLARDQKSVDTLKRELDGLQQDLARAHEQVHLSEARVSQSLAKLADMERMVNDKILHSQSELNTSVIMPSIQEQHATNPPATQNDRKVGPRRKSLNISGPVQPYSPSLLNFWYPVAFSTDIKADTMVPFECFEEPWVLFRGEVGKIGCVQNSCAHRACPLDLGKVNEGRIQCPYHGWEYSTNGSCEKMPSTRPMKVSIRSLPCVEQDGLVWIWPGSAIPEPFIRTLLPPDGFTIHAQIVMDLPVEHGLLMENLLDLAHAPFTHTTTFAKGWPVPSFVKFRTPMKALEGYWDPYPIDMEFQPPCMVRSVIGISKPGTLDGKDTASCSKHLHQLHVCLPSSRGKTRLLYRMSLDFYPILRHVPFIDYLWRYLAKKVLDEDLRLVLGQQERMAHGFNVWNMPVTYDKLGLRYRRWRVAIEAGEKVPWS